MNSEEEQPSQAELLLEAAKREAEELKQRAEQDRNSQIKARADVLLKKREAGNEAYEDAKLVQEQMVSVQQNLDSAIESLRKIEASQAGIEELGLGEDVKAEYIKNFERLKVQAENEITRWEAEKAHLLQLLEDHNKAAVENDPEIAETVGLGRKLNQAELQALVAASTERLENEKLDEEYRKHSKAVAESYVEILTTKKDVWPDTAQAAAGKIKIDLTNQVAYEHIAKLYDYASAGFKDKQAGYYLRAAFEERVREVTSGNNGDEFNKAYGQMELTLLLHGHSGAIEYVVWDGKNRFNEQEPERADNTPGFVADLPEPYKERAVALLADKVLDPDKVKRVFENSAAYDAEALSVIWEEAEEANRSETESLKEKKLTEVGAEIAKYHSALGRLPETRGYWKELQNWYFWHNAFTETNKGYVEIKSNLNRAQTDLQNEPRTRIILGVGGGYKDKEKAHKLELEIARLERVLREQYEGEGRTWFFQKGRLQEAAQRLGLQPAQAPEQTESEVNAKLELLDEKEQEWTEALRKAEWRKSRYEKGFNLKTKLLQEEVELLENDSRVMDSAINALAEGISSQFPGQRSQWKNVDSIWQINGTQITNPDRVYIYLPNVGSSYNQACRLLQKAKSDDVFKVFGLRLRNVLGKRLQEPFVGTVKVNGREVLRAEG